MQRYVLLLLLLGCLVIGLDASSSGLGSNPERKSLCPARIGQLLKMRLIPVNETFDLTLREDTWIGIQVVGHISTSDGLFVFDSYAPRFEYYDSYHPMYPFGSLGMLTSMGRQTVMTDSSTGRIRICRPLNPWEESVNCTSLAIDIPLMNPQAASIDPLDGGTLVIADTGNHVIRRANVTDGWTAGTVIATYGLPGSGPGQFDSPTKALVNTENGEIYVADIGNNRIQVLSRNGTFLRILKSWKGTSAVLTNIQSAIDMRDGVMHVCLRGDNRIETLNLTNGATIFTLPLSEPPVAVAYLSYRGTYNVLFNNPTRLAEYSDTECSLVDRSEIVRRILGPDSSLRFFHHDYYHDHEHEMAVEFLSLSQVHPSTGDSIPDTTVVGFTNSGNLIASNVTDDWRFQSPERLYRNISLSYKIPSTSSPASFRVLHRYAAYDSGPDPDDGHPYEVLPAGLSKSRTVAINTHIVLANYTFSDPSAGLQIVWQLRHNATLDRDSLATTVDKHARTTTYTLRYSGSRRSSNSNTNELDDALQGNFHPDGLYVRCINYVLVDGVEKPVRLHFDAATQQLAVTFPSFSSSLEYEVDFGWFSEKVVTYTGDEIIGFPDILLGGLVALTIVWVGCLLMVVVLALVYKALKRVHDRGSAVVWLGKEDSFSVESLEQEGDIEMETLPDGQRKTEGAPCPVDQQSQRPEGESVTNECLVNKET